MKTQPKIITLANLAQATEQEVYDHVCWGLREQGFSKSFNVATDTCAYYATSLDKTLRCAAGQLITPGQYRLGWEGMTWRDLVNGECVPFNNAGLIVELQRAHDQSSGPKSMRNNLLDVGSLYRLKTGVLEEA